MKEGHSIYTPAGESGDVIAAAQGQLTFKESESKCKVSRISPWLSSSQKFRLVYKVILQICKDLMKIHVCNLHIITENIIT